MTPFQLADIAEKTRFKEVAVLLRSGTAEAGELYSAILLMLAISPKRYISVSVDADNKKVFRTMDGAMPGTPDRHEIDQALTYYVKRSMREPDGDVRVNIPVWIGDQGRYTILSAFDERDPHMIFACEALESGSTTPLRQPDSPSAVATVVWGKEATYNRVKRIDGTATDDTRFRMEKGPNDRFWNLGVFVAWEGEKYAKEKWDTLLTGEKSALTRWVNRIMSSHDRPEDKGKWSAWLDPVVKAESYSTQRGQLHFTPEERREGKTALLSAMKEATSRKLARTPVVRRSINRDARTPIEINIPDGLTQGNFVVSASFFPKYETHSEEAPLNHVLGDSFIEIDIVKAKLPTKWHPQEWHISVLTVQSFDGSKPIDIGLNGKWLAGLVGVVAGKTGQVRYFATATKRATPQPLAPILVVGPDGTGAVIMPFRLD